MDINTLIWTIAGGLGLAPGTLAIVLGAVIMGANITSRLIPDTAVGYLGTIRTVASWIGIHVRNNSGTAPIATGESGVVIPTEAQSKAGLPGATVTELVDAAALTEPAVKDAFGQAATKLSQTPLAVIMLFLAIMPLLMTLQACATTSDVSLSNDVCTHQIILRQGALTTLSQSYLIKDVAARQAAENAANATLALIAVCPAQATPSVAK